MNKVEENEWLWADIDTMAERTNALPILVEKSLGDYSIPRFICLSSTNYLRSTRLFFPCSLLHVKMSLRMLSTNSSTRGIRLERHLQQSYEIPIRSMPLHGELSCINTFVVSPILFEPCFSYKLHQVFSICLDQCNVLYVH